MRQVWAVFEAKFFDGLNYTQLVEWTRGYMPEGATTRWEWDPISRGTVFAWYQQALQWWLVNERLTPDEEYVEILVGLKYVAQEGVREYRAGRLDYDTWAKTATRLAAELRMLTGAGRVIDDGRELPAPPPQAQAMIDEMKTRRGELSARRERGRKVIG